MLMMVVVNAPQFPASKLGRGFLPNNEWAPNNQLGKTTAEQCKVNALQSKKLLFLGLRKHLYGQPVCARAYFRKKGQGQM